MNITRDTERVGNEYELIFASTEEKRYALKGLSFSVNNAIPKESQAGYFSFLSLFCEDNAESIFFNEDMANEMFGRLLQLSIEAGVFGINAEELIKSHEEIEIKLLGLLDERKGLLDEAIDEIKYLNNENSSLKKQIAELKNRLGEE